MIGDGLSSSLVIDSSAALPCPSSSENSSFHTYFPLERTTLAGVSHFLEPHNGKARARTSF